MTSAHILSLGLQQLLPEPDSTSLRSTVRPVEGGFVADVDEFDVNPLDHQVKRLCEPCNRGWMAPIETATKTAIADMAWGRPVILDATLQRELATWAATVIALRAASYRSDMPTCVPLDDLAEMRLVTQAPRTWRIWLVRTMGVPVISWAHLRRMNLETQQPGFVAWLLMGEFGVLVAGGGIVPAFTTRMDPTPRRYLRPLHPASESEIDWSDTGPWSVSTFERLAFLPGK